MKTRLLIFLVSVVFVGCSDTPHTGSETHWLSCSTTEDCPGGSVCVEGRCTDTDAGWNVGNMADASENDGSGTDGSVAASTDDASGCPADPDVECCGDPPDFYYDAVCVNGSWECPADTIEEPVGTVCEGPPAVDMGSGSDAQADDVISASDDQLTFFHLPINSERSAISTYDADRDLCVSVIWDFSNTGHDYQQWCDPDWGAMFPYVYVEAGSDAGCWDYGPNAEVVSSSGCVEFEIGNPGTFDVADDVVVEVDSPLFSGTIMFDNQP